MEMKKEVRLAGNESSGWSIAAAQLEKDIKAGEKAALETHISMKPPLQKKRGSSLAKVLLTMLLTVGMTAGLVGCSLTGAEEITESPGIPVEVMSLVIDRQQMETRYTGILAAEKVVTQSFSSGGKVETLLVQTGDRVKAGDPLASLEQQSFQHALNAAEAQLSAAEAQYQMALQGGREETAAMTQAEVTMAEEKLAYVTEQTQRATTLYQQGVISQQAWEEAALLETQTVLALEQARWKLVMTQEGLRPEEVEQLRQQYLAAGAGRDALAKQLEDVTLTAGFDGYVAGVHVEAGEVTGAGIPVVTLASEALRGIVGLTREDMQRVKVGDAVEVMAEGKVFPGIIAVLHPFPDPQTRTYTVEIALDDSLIPRDPLTDDSLSESPLLATSSAPVPSTPSVDSSTTSVSWLVPGQVVTVIFPGESLSGIWVPVQYVANDGEAYVYLVEDGRARRHAVTLDVIQEDQVLITGVTPGALLITEGAGGVREGDAVAWQEP
ncbi:efflux RND transporter periplasmic adaptor subunit [Anoxynatronum buryatiense]|uniref:Multidrug resistance efflux pump n=1 Tax=Anoxynatronum buryatiense TaxID=489973 RepID=A0AA46AIJ2_9CLOT|nr:HlyD family efflux transporter periplasmic adaptor subunit [Anoxynatronum buryatiense]SMP51031.1 Multidrug resistance efflux pump [Anoxynatronum buryatiense]